MHTSLDIHVNNLQKFTGIYGFLACLRILCSFHKSSVNIVFIIHKKLYIPQVQFAQRYILLPVILWGKSREINKYDTARCLELVVQRTLSLVLSIR
jgi:hypothetical protein